MKTLDMQGNSYDWVVEQGRVLQDLPANDAAVFHAAYWERQHNKWPQGLLAGTALAGLRQRR
ncbi:MAG: hypothetical protein P8Y53_17065 [Pseudolabrys sp.]|jgi:hypothetical protein